MKQNNFEKVEVTQGNMKVILEFPARSEQDEIIKQEVRSILSSSLQEYFQKGAFKNEAGTNVITGKF
jgi:hypothetical protein